MNSQDKTGIVASLFVLALCFLVVGGISVYENFDFWLHGEKATMELADPDKEVVQYFDVLSIRTLDVRYVSDAADLVVTQKTVPVDVATRLAAGDRIPITYMTNNPGRVFYQNQRPPSPWLWLIVGAATLAAAIYALKLRKREMVEL
jgi:hypothetical protein